MIRSLIRMAVVFALASVMVTAARAGGFEDARRISEMATIPDLAGRLAVCHSVLEDKPVPWSRAFCEGYLALADGNETAAKSSLEEALKDRKDLALAAILYGDLSVEKGRTETGIAFYRRALEIQPGRADALFALGSAYFHLGQDRDPKFYTQALESFREVAEADPDSPDGWSHMAVVLTYMSRFSDAEAMYRKAIEKSPQDPFLYDGLASLFSRQDRNEEAADNWRRAVGLNPGYGPAVVELAALEARNGRLGEALTALERGREASKVAPWGSRIRRMLGFAYLRIGLDEVAQIRFQEAARIGGDALADLGLAHMRMLANDVDAALPEFEAGATLDSTLAVPFVRAWKEPLEKAVQVGTTPSLVRVLIGLGGSAASGKTPAPPIAPSLRGKEATNALAESVLDGWSFAHADEVKTTLQSPAADSLGNRYDTPPVPIKQVAAEYPESAQDAGLSGLVQVRITIDETGKVIDAVSEDCNAPMLLCQSALSAARKWTFQPATRYGQPVRSSVVVPFRFRSAEH